MPFVRQMLQQCLPSVSTLEAMLNSYAVVPPCDWLDSVSPEVFQVSGICPLGSTSRLAISSARLPLPLPQKQPLFWESLRQRSGQPRSLQHLCRHFLRSHLGARCPSALAALDIPSSVREYLLLRDDGSLH